MECAVFGQENAFTAILPSLAHRPELVKLTNSGSGPIPLGYGLFRVGQLTQSPFGDSKLDNSQKCEYRKREYLICQEYVNGIRATFLCFDTVLQTLVLLSLLRVALFVKGNQGLVPWFVMHDGYKKYRPVTSVSLNARL